METVFVKLRSPRIMVTVAVVMILAMLLAAGWRYLRPPPTVNEPYLAALFEVRNVLKYPTGAVYSRYDSDPASILHLRHDGSYDVTGWVEADNGYGQRVRRDWRCIVRPQGGGRYLPVYVQVGQLTVGTAAPDEP
jgi:hypothetical protein